MSDPYARRSWRSISASLMCATLVSGLPAASVAQPTLHADQWREDLRFLATELPRRHPNLFHTVSRERFDSSVRALDARIPSLAPHQLLIELARLTAMVGELHTGIALHRQPRALLSGLHAFPIRFRIFDEGLFIEAISAPHASFVGARVMRIGGRSWDDAYRRIAEIVLADNQMGRAKLTPVYLSIAEALSAVEVIDDGTRLPLSVEMTDGSRADFILSSAPLPDFPPLLNPEADPTGVAGFVSMRDGATLSPPLWLQNVDSRYWWRHLSENNTAYVRIDVMVDKTEEPMSAFFRRVLHAVDSLQPQRMVIDLRRNNGGNNLALPLIEGILARPTLNQPGKILVLVGRGTVSSGQNLATLLERYTNAVFFGEPTAQRPNHYGVMGQFALPNSRINVTHSRFLLIDSDPDDVRPWLSPDVAVSLSSRQYREHRDPVFDAALAYRPVSLPPLAEALADAYLPSFTFDSLAIRYRELRPLFDSARNELKAEMIKLGHNLLAWRKEEDAIRVFDLLIETMPDSYRAHAARASALSALGRDQESALAWQRAVELNPWLRQRR